MNMCADPRIPIFVLTGFLGAGKTTVLSALMAAGRLNDTLLIINEVGETGVDQDLLKGASLDAPLLLPGGCLCCSLKGDLGYTLRDIQLRIERGTARPFEKVVIETTGIADPAPILQAILTDRWVSSRYRVGRTVAVADAEHLIATCEESQTAVSQLVHADTVLLSKTDLAAPEQISRALSYLVANAPNAEVLFSGEAMAGNWTFTPVPTVFRRGDLAADCCPVHGPDCTAGHAPHGIGTRQIGIRDGVGWAEFARAMDGFAKANSGTLLRMKGFVRPAESVKPLCIQSVRTTFYPPQIIDGPGLPSGLNSMTVIYRGELREPSLRALEDAVGMKGAPYLSGVGGGAFAADRYVASVRQGSAPVPSVHG